MTPILLIALGATVFVEQHVPGLHVGAVNPLSGTTAANFRHADLDRDGLTDLVFPTAAHFQREGLFRRGDRVPLPAQVEGALCDLWDGDVYFWLEQGLRVFRWEGSLWQLVLECRMPAANFGGSTTSLGLADEFLSSSVRFHRFLHDVDGDGVPEIVYADEDGLRVLRLQGDRYGEVGRLAIYPPFRVISRAEQALWPRQARGIVSPARRMACRFFLEGSTVCVLTREEAGDSTVRYRCRTYTLEVGDGAISLAGEPRQELSEPLPSYVWACRLNDDGRIDFAGTEWELGPTSAMPSPVYHGLPVPVCTTYASLDGGRTATVVRTPSYRPRCSFVDFDGDGDLDMVLGRTGLSGGGIREELGRLMTRPEVKHDILVRFQDDSGAFSQSADVEARFTIRLDRESSWGSDVLRRYRAAELVDVTGDFNGDGARDVVVQEAPERLAIYLNLGQGFGRDPDAAIGLREAGRFGVMDVDGDGRSDIAVSWTEDEGGPRTDKSYVFFARGEP